MSELDLLLIARVLHVVASTLWGGGAILIAAYLLPAIRAAGPAGSAVMRQLTVVRKLPEALAAIGIVAIVSGGYLYWVDSRGLQASWLASGCGLAYAAGGLASLAAAAIGLGINIPTANRMGSLAQALHASGAPPTPEQSQILGRFAVRIARGTRAVAVLLALAVTAMAVARYLP
ncbi:MAG TPA: DUF2269 family protein [Steroidobacteraceae bacterium]|nr:DUF2269 family protein [Steroidobacteraceae bacterium]